MLLNSLSSPGIFQTLWAKKVKQNQQTKKKKNLNRNTLVNSIKIQGKGKDLELWKQGREQAFTGIWGAEWLLADS